MRCVKGRLWSFFGTSNINHERCDRIRWIEAEVGSAKTDLTVPKRDLEGTQRQPMEVRDSLSAAAARNASELPELLPKGERDYVEFSCELVAEISG